MHRDHVLHSNTIRLTSGASSSSQQGDDLCTLMQCLALVFEKCPNIIVSHAAEAANSFLSWMPDSRFLRKSSAVDS